MSSGRASSSEGRKKFWAYAAAFGALWGTVEITLGSFLHSLHLPFGGALLASIGAGLLVAQRQIFPARGSTLAAGLIAALCKSLSPGGIILGPMIGITVEAALVELALLLAPRAALSAVVAGMLSAQWAVFQKVVSKYVVYGGTIIELYLAALRKADDVLRVRNGGWMALAVLVGLLALLGAVCGVLGRSIGRESQARLLLGPREATS